MMTTLEIRANVKFDSVDEARVAGQAIEQLLGIKGQNNVRIFDFELKEGRRLASKRVISLYPPKPHVGGTRGRQDMEGRLTNLVKNLHSSIPALPVDADLKEGVIVLDGRDWVLNYQVLFDLIGVHVDKSEAKDAFNAAVALTLQQEATRGVK